MKLESVIFESKNGPKAVLLREGVSMNGNKWTKEVIEQILSLVDNVPVNIYDASSNADKSMLTHWESLRQRIPPGIRKLLPNKLPEAQVGVVKNAKVVVGADGIHELVSDIEPLNTDSAQTISALIRQAKAQGNNIGPSIHVAEGDIVSNVDAKGIRTPTMVNKVTGFEIVSIPSAGGKFIPVLEALDISLITEDEMNFSERLLHLLPDADRQKLTEKHKLETDITVESMVDNHSEFVGDFLNVIGFKCADDKTTRTTVLEKLAEIGPDVTKTVLEKPAPVVEEKIVKVQEPNDDSAVMEELNNLKRSLNRANVVNKIKEADLAAEVASTVEKHFTKLIDDQKVHVLLESVDEFIVDLKKGLGKTQKTGEGLLEMSDPKTQIVATEGDKARVAFEAMMNNEEFGYIGEGANKIKVPAFNGLRHAYGMMTGDVFCEGQAFYTKPRSDRNKSMLESYDWDDNIFANQYRTTKGVTEALIDTTTFPLILSDHMHKAMLREYNQMDLMWKQIAKAERVTDFKLWYHYRMGEMADLLTKAEGASYGAAVAQPSEEHITLQIAKYGGIATMTWESIVNDDLRQMQAIPRKFARAANRTLNTAVFDNLASNLDYTTDSNGGVSLANAAHNNYATVALSLAQLKLMRQEIMAQTDMDSKEAYRVAPRKVFVGPELFDAAYEILFSDGKAHLEPGTVGSGDRDNPGQPNVLRSKWGLELYEIPQLDANDYWMTGSPNECDMIAVGFLNGKQNPELFVQDLDRVGSFFDNDIITWKIRHIWGVSILDYRPFAGRIVA